MKLSRILMALTLLALAAGCEMTAVDYGDARWMYVHPTLDDGWFAAIKEGSDLWNHQYGKTVRVTRDPKATKHVIYPISEQQCFNIFEELHGPGSYSFFVENSDTGCMGMAAFNAELNTWKIGLVVDFWVHPITVNGEVLTLNYYDRVILAAHELGHVLGCQHTKARCKPPEPGCDPHETKPGIMHYGQSDQNTRKDLFLTAGDYEACPTL